MQNPTDPGREQLQQRPDLQCGTLGSQERDEDPSSFVFVCRALSGGPEAERGGLGDE